MAIRIRKINDETIALCAVEFEPKVGDIYLDDVIDHALRKKFIKDYESEGVFFKKDLSKIVKGYFKCKDRILYGPLCKICRREEECEKIERQIWEDFKETEDYKFELDHGRQFPEDFEI